MALNWSQQGYRLLLRGLSPAALAWLWWRGRKDPGYRENMAQRRGQIEPRPSSLHGILIHAASVGEVQAAQPLIAALREHWPDHTITVTTQTPTGARALNGIFGDALQHLFFPVDTPVATTKFLDRLQPRLVILIEREMWPEWLLQCQNRAIPVALVNARLSEKSAKTNHRLRKLMQPSWQSLALVVAADEDSAKRIGALGVAPERILLTGNLKFDQAPQASPTDVQTILIARRPMVVAGSTHEGEESALLDAWPTLLAKIPNAILVLVPRHPERFDTVATDIQSRGWRFARRSLEQTPDAETSIWLGDTMGELGSWYQQASLCFIGGTLVPIGGHNPLEALAVGKPVVFGPHTVNASALFAAISEQQIGQQVTTGVEAIELAAQWLAYPEALQKKGVAAGNFVRNQQGSSQHTLQALKALWQPCDPMRLKPIVETCFGATTIWHDPQWTNIANIADIFNPPAADATLLATGSGRGQAQRMTLGGKEVVLRHYRRGGLVARFNADRYRLTSTSQSRAMGEFALLRWMHACGLPVPEPVAARQEVTGNSYRADIIVGMIPGTQNLVQRLSIAPLAANQWHAIGQAIHRLHSAQVFHSDLNAHNLLLSDPDQAWIVDFDKCAVRGGGEWKHENLARLLRSLRKELGKLPRFEWKEARDWPSLIEGYEASQGLTQAGTLPRSLKEPNAVHA